MKQHVAASGIRIPAFYAPDTSAAADGPVGSVGPVGSGGPVGPVGLRGTTSGPIGSDGSVCSGGSEAALRFAGEHGWPVVVKTRLGYASTNVRVVRTPADLTAEVRARDADDVLVEEFVPGPVCHVDGFCSGGRCCSPVRPGM